MKISNKLTFSFFVISLIPVVLIMIFIYFSVSNSLLSESLLKEKQEIKLEKEKIDNFLNDCRYNVLYLSSLSSLNNLINSDVSSDIDKYRKLTSRDFLTFAQQNSKYYQVRYIDNNGREVIRVNNIGDGSILMSESNLQNKSERYYFIDTMELSKGEVFVSPLDLNKEKGIIENRGTERDPKYVPVIRYATPVFSKNGQRKGIVILNVYANNFLGKLKSKNNRINIILINSKGYFLYHYDHRKEWGFVFNNNERIDKYFSDAKTLLNSDDDQIFDKNLNKYLTFIRIYPSEKNILRLENDVRQDKFWVLISEINKNDIEKPINILLFQSILIITLLLLLILIFSFFFSLSITKPLKKINKGIKVITNGNLDYKIETNSKDELGQIANSFNRMAKKLKLYYENIEKEVKERTKQLNDLNDHMVGRELEMIKLKKRLQKKSKNYEKNDKK